VKSIHSSKCAIFFQQDDLALINKMICILVSVNSRFAKIIHVFLILILTIIFNMCYYLFQEGGRILMKNKRVLLTLTIAAFILVLAASFVQASINTDKSACCGGDCGGCPSPCPSKAPACDGDCGGCPSPCPSKAPACDGDCGGCPSPCPSKAPACDGNCGGGCPSPCPTK
jgi:hypothetical protein